MIRPRKRAHKKYEREEGAVMLIVMLILLMSTATAIYAMHSTSYEVRAAGHARSAMQTEVVGETGLNATAAWADAITPQNMLTWLQQCSSINRARDGVALNMDPFEPALDPTKDACRLYAQDFAQVSPVLMMEGRTSVGPRQPMQTLLLVDVYENFESGEVRAGTRADSAGRFHMMDVTFTSRGRQRLPTDVTTTVSGDRQYNEAASDGRVFAITGPIMR